MKEEASGNTSAHDTTAEDARLRGEQLVEKGPGEPAIFKAEPHTVTSPSVPGWAHPR